MFQKANNIATLGPLPRTESVLTAQDPRDLATPQQAVRGCKEALRALDS
jgi:hypothetical protein